MVMLREADVASELSDVCVDIAGSARLPASWTATLAFLWRLPDDLFVFVTKFARDVTSVYALWAYGALIAKRQRKIRGPLAVRALRLSDAVATGDSLEAFGLENFLCNMAALAIRSERGWGGGRPWCPIVVDGRIFADDLARRLTRDPSSTLSRMLQMCINVDWSTDLLDSFQTVVNDRFHVFPRDLYLGNQPARYRWSMVVPRNDPRRLVGNGRTLDVPYLKQLVRQTWRSPRNIEEIVASLGSGDSNVISDVTADSSASPRTFGVVASAARSGRRIVSSSSSSSAIDSSRTERPSPIMPPPQLPTAKPRIADVTSDVTADSSASPRTFGVVTSAARSERRIMSSSSSSSSSAIDASRTERTSPIMPLPTAKPRIVSIETLNRHRVKLVAIRTSTLPPLTPDLLPVVRLSRLSSSLVARYEPPAIEWNDSSSSSSSSSPPPSPPPPPVDTLVPTVRLRRLSLSALVPLVTSTPIAAYAETRAVSLMSPPSIPAKRARTEDVTAPERPTRSDTPATTKTSATTSRRGRPHSKIFTLEQDGLLVKRGAATCNLNKLSYWIALQEETRAFPGLAPHQLRNRAKVLVLGNGDPALDVLYPREMATMRLLGRYRTF